MADDWKKPISSTTDIDKSSSEPTVESTVVEAQEDAPPKKEPTTPWKPASLLAGVKPRPGFRGRWTRSDAVEKRKLEGWVIVEAQGITGKTILDATKLGAFTKSRGLVWMEIPEELAKEREAFYKRLTDGAIKSRIEEFSQIADEGSGSSYGKITIERGE